MTDEKVVTRRTNPCSNCDAPVSVRRPSATGKHWCRKVDCQRARAKFYRKKPTDEGALEREKRNAAELKERLDFINSFLASAYAEQRIECDICRVDDALPGFIHPGPTFTPCYGTSDPNAPHHFTTKALITVIWKHRAPIASKSQEA